MDEKKVSKNEIYSLLNLIIKYLPAIAIIGYILGYLNVNSYFWRFKVQLNLFSIQYISSGILLLMIISLIIFLLYIYQLLEFPNKGMRSIWSINFLLMVALSSLFIGTAIFYGHLLIFNQNKSQVTQPISLYQILLLCFIAVLNIPGLLIQILRKPSKVLSILAPIGSLLILIIFLLSNKSLLNFVPWVIAVVITVLLLKNTKLLEYKIKPQLVFSYLFLLLAIPISFGLFYYPKIHPIIGGGKPTRVILVSSPGYESKLSQMEIRLDSLGVSQEVLMVGQSSQFHYFELRQGKSRPSLIAIPPRVLSGIIYCKE